MSIAIGRRPTMFSSTDRQSGATISPLEPPSASLLIGGSLLFQFENLEDVKQPPVSSVGNITAAHERTVASVQDIVKFYSKPSESFASRLLCDVLSFKRMLLRDEDEVDTVVIASKLSSIGYCLSVRNALGASGASKASCFQNLRHEFLLVRCNGSEEDYRGVEYVVDLRFREQFAIPHPTDTYAAIIETVPEIYVGPVSRIIPIVQALCIEMAQSFAAKGLTLPPWRKTQSILSKWVTANARDINIACPLSPATIGPVRRTLSPVGGCGSEGCESSSVEGLSPTSVLPAAAAAGHAASGDSCDPPASPTTSSLSSHGFMRISFTRKSRDAVQTVGFDAPPPPGETRSDS